MRLKSFINVVCTKKGHNCTNTTFSKILNIKGRLEIGLRLSRIDVSEFGVFKIGIIVAYLRLSRTIPVLRLKFTKNRAGMRTDSGSSIIFLQVGKVRSKEDQVAELHGVSWMLESECKFLGSQPNSFLSKEC